MSRALGASWDEVADEAREKAPADFQAGGRPPTAEAAMKWQEIVASVTAEWAKWTPPTATKLLAAFHGFLREVRAGNLDFAAGFQGLAFGQARACLPSGMATPLPDSG